MSRRRGNQRRVAAPLVETPLPLASGAGSAAESPPAPLPPVPPASSFGPALPSLPPPPPPASDTKPALPLVTTSMPRAVMLPLPSGEETAPHSGFERALALPLAKLAPLLSCFSTSEARPLRALCRSAEAHIAAHPWADMSTPVTDLAKWRACFPNAVAVKLSPRVAWSPAALPFLAGITGLNVAELRDALFLITLRTADVFASLKACVLAGCPRSILHPLVTDNGVAPPVVAAACAAVSDKGAPPLPETTISSVLASLSPALHPRVVQARLGLLAYSEWVSRDLKALIVGTVGINRVISMLRAFKLHAEIAAPAARLLAAFQQKPPLAMALAHAGPVPALLAVLDAHPSNPSIADNVSMVLSELPELTPTAVGVMLANDAPRILLTALAGCLSDVRSVNNVCSALSILLKHSQKRTTELILACVPSAIDTLFTALAVNVAESAVDAVHAVLEEDDVPHSALVLNCMKTLGFIVSGGGSEAVGAAVRAGTVRAVVAAAAVHAGDPNVLLCAAALLFAAVEPIVKDLNGRHGVDVSVLIDAGAVETLLAAVKASPDSVILASNALQALLWVAPAHEVEQLLSSHRIIVTMASNLGTAPAEQLHPRLSVAHMCWKKAPTVVASQLAAPGVPQALVATLRNKEGPGADLALQLLYTTSKVSAGAVAAAASGALVEALRSHPSHSTKEVELVLRLLAHTCVCGGALAVDAAVAAGAPAAVISALGKGATLKAVEAAAVSLFGMAQHRGEAVAHAGGTTVLLQLLKAHGNVPSLRETVRSAAVQVVLRHPASLVPHVAEVTELALTALGAAAAVGNYVAGWEGVMLVNALLKSGAPAGLLVAALQRVRPALTAAVRAAHALVASARGPAQEAWTAAEVMVAAKKLSARVAAYAREHGEVAAQLEGW